MKIIQLRSQNRGVNTNQPLNQAASSSAPRFGIELIRVQPRDDMLQVWVKPLSFDSLLDWMQFMHTRYGISVEFLDIDRGDKSGVVEVKRLQLKRG